MPDWSMKNWSTDGKITLLEAFGISGTKFHFPKLKATLPAASSRAQHPLAVSASQTNPSLKKGSAPAQKGPIKQYARKLLVKNGWTGASQWAAFNNIVMAESGWNPKIVETQSIGGQPPTYAYGIAQAYDHGEGSKTQGTYSNMYGGYGLTDKQAKAANSGDGYWQLVWMTNYIRQTYGTPEKAWAYHQAHDSY
jgi:hypothetical protein